MLIMYFIIIMFFIIMFAILIIYLSLIYYLYKENKMEATSPLSIRRQVTIPKKVNNRNVLAVIEVGGKLFNKDHIYRMIWSLGLEQLENYLRKELKDAGRSNSDYDAMYNRAVKEVSNA